jgi:hypothetical protein
LARFARRQVPELAANGTLIEIWTCNGSANQRWSR